MELRKYVLDFIREHQLEYTFIELKHSIPHYNGNISTHDVLCDLFNSDVLGMNDDFKVFIEEGQ